MRSAERQLVADEGQVRLRVVRAEQRHGAAQAGVRDGAEQQPEQQRHQRRRGQLPEHVIGRPGWRPGDIRHTRWYASFYRVTHLGDENLPLT